LNPEICGNWFELFKQILLQLDAAYNVDTILDPCAALRNVREPIEEVEELDIPEDPDGNLRRRRTEGRIRMQRGLLGVQARRLRRDAITRNDLRFTRIDGAQIPPPVGMGGPVFVGLTIEEKIVALQEILRLICGPRDFDREIRQLGFRLGAAVNQQNNDAIYLALINENLIQLYLDIINFRADRDIRAQIRAFFVNASEIQNYPFIAEQAALSRLRNYNRFRTNDLFLQRGI
jgi:hypothetical protein